MMALETALRVAMILTVVGLVCACIRLIIGPSRSDRVVSLDLITVLLVAIAAQLAMLYKVAAYLDLGLAIALVGFLATVAFARYIETAEHGYTTADTRAGTGTTDGVITETGSLQEKTNAENLK